MPIFPAPQLKKKERKKQELTHNGFKDCRGKESWMTKFTCTFVNSLK